MIINKDMYRNLPAPVGYVCTNPPEIVFRKKISEEEELIVLNSVVESGILDEPDCTIYDHFVINSDSEDEADDLIEIPVEKVTKHIEEIAISDDEVPAVEVKKEVLVKVKEEVVSEDPASCLKEIDVEKEKKESCIETEKIEKQKCESKSSHKKSKQKKETSHSIHSESASVKKEKKHKKKHASKSNASGSGVESSHKDRPKLIDYDDSDSSGSNKRRMDDEKQDNYKKKEKRLKKSEYESKSSSVKLKANIKHDYEEDEDRISKHSPSHSKNYNFDEYYDSEEDYKPNIKQEASQSLFGVYNCEVCNLTLNSASTYQSHMSGKRHKKALNAQNVAQAVSKCFVSANVESKCPKPSAGFTRIELKEPARIQNVLDVQLKMPCPGLHHVYEIHGIMEITYYCTLCDAPCNFNSIVPHLQGFKHQLNCLKYYKPDLYDKINYKQKYIIEDIVKRELTAVVNEMGRSALRVFRDISEYDNSKVKSESSSRSEDVPQPDYDQPSTSRQGLGKNTADIYHNYSVPDPSKSGFYCRLCDSHSNSENMWRNHIVGKRHLANMKKAPGSAPSKSKYIPAPPGTRPKLHSMLRDIREPIIGLTQIREIHKPDIDAVTFTCYLCSACISEFEIIDHILSRKHREKYLEKINFDEYFTLKNCHISPSSLESIIEEMAGNVEYNEGRGVPEVVYAKNAIIPPRM